MNTKTHNALKLQKFGYKDFSNMYLFTAKYLIYRCEVGFNLYPDKNVID